MTGAGTQEKPASSEFSAISEALAIIDKALAEMLRRELIASGDVSDLLLDVRSVLTAAHAATSDA